jgi:hypothetical protein
LTTGPLTAADQAALARLPDGVSPQSAIGRFHGALNRLTDPLLDAARFTRDEDASSTAEVAIIIADDCQRQRAALLLFDRLKFR